MITQYEFERLNKNNGYHFFDANTMRFFKSRISHWRTDGYFITREATNFSKTNFAYSIRYANHDTLSLTCGNVEKISDFLAYKTLKTAQNYLNKIRLNASMDEARQVCHYGDE